MTRYDTMRELPTFRLVSPLTSQTASAENLGQAWAAAFAGGAKIRRQS